MDLVTGMKIIETGWAKKSKGFRVKYQKLTENGLEDGYSPPMEAGPLTSDVTTWRYAWKLWQATKDKTGEDALNILYNITVVNDQDIPVRFYGTGEYKTYNQSNPA